MRAAWGAPGSDARVVLCRRHQSFKDDPPPPALIHCSSVAYRRADDAVVAVRFGGELITLNLQDLESSRPSAALWCLDVASALHSTAGANRRASCTGASKALRSESSTALAPAGRCGGARRSRGSSTRGAALPCRHHALPCVDERRCAAMPSPCTTVRRREVLRCHAVTMHHRASTRGAALPCRHHASPCVDERCCAAMPSPCTTVRRREALRCHAVTMHHRASTRGAALPCRHHASPCVDERRCAAMPSPCHHRASTRGRCAAITALPSPPPPRRRWFSLPPSIAPKRPV